MNHTVRSRGRSAPGDHVPRYFLTTLAVFWIPVAALSILIWKKLSRTDKSAFWFTTSLLTILTTIMESIYRATKIWTFSEKCDSLLGVRIGGEPVEEYSFWFGATPFMLLVYLALHRLFHGGRSNE